LEKGAHSEQAVACEQTANSGVQRKLTLWQQQLTQFAHVLQVESFSDAGGGGRPAGRTRQAVGGHFGNDSPGALRPQFQRVDRPSEQDRYAVPCAFGAKAVYGFTTQLLPSTVSSPG